jgi:hypothetical protein
MRETTVAIDEGGYWHLTVAMDGSNRWARTSNKSMLWMMVAATKRVRVARVMVTTMRVWATKRVS